MGVRFVLFIPQKRQGLWLESQAGTADLSRPGAQFADQTKAQTGARKAGATGGSRRTQ